MLYDMSQFGSSNWDKPAVPCPQLQTYRSCLPNPSSGDPIQRCAHTEENRGHCAWFKDVYICFNAFRSYLCCCLRLIPCAYCCCVCQFNNCENNSLDTKCNASYFEHLMSLIPLYMYTTEWMSAFRCHSFKKNVLIILIFFNRSIFSLKEEFSLDDPIP